MSGPVDAKFLKDLGLPGLEEEDNLQTFLMGISPASFDQDDARFAAEVLHGLGYVRRENYGDSAGEKQRKSPNATREKEKLIFRNLERLIGHDGGPPNHPKLLSESLHVLRHFHRSCLEGLYVHTHDLLQLRFSSTPSPDRHVQTYLAKIFQAAHGQTAIRALDKIEGWKADAALLFAAEGRHGRLNECEAAIRSYVPNAKKGRPVAFACLEDHLRRCYFTMDRAKFLPATVCASLYRCAWVDPLTQSVSVTRPTEVQRFIRSWFFHLKGKQVVFPQDALLGKPLAEGEKAGAIKKALQMAEAPGSREAADRMIKVLKNALKRQS